MDGSWDEGGEEQVAGFIDGCAGGEFAGGVGLAEVRAAVVRLSSQGVRKAVASGPEVLRSISLVV